MRTLIGAAVSTILALGVAGCPASGVVSSPSGGAIGGSGGDSGGSSIGTSGGTSGAGVTAGASSGATGSQGSSVGSTGKGGSTGAGASTAAGGNGSSGAGNGSSGGAGSSGAHSSSGSSTGTAHTSGGSSGGAPSSGGAASSGGGVSAGGSSNGGGTGVTFAIDLNAGPSRQFDPPGAPVPVSPYVYGINGFGSFVAQKTQWGIIRQGGDAFTDWNWTNNYGNAGADYCWNQNPGSGGAVLAGSILQNGDSIPATQARGEAYVTTVPILGFVSAAEVNNPYQGGNPTCPGTPSCGGTDGTAVNTGAWPFPCTGTTMSGGTCAANADFVTNNAVKSGALCTPGAGSCAGVSTTGPVYQDEFVNFLKTEYGGGAPLFLMLDNEPNYWGSTHPELWLPDTGAVGTGGCQTSTVTFADVVNYELPFAKMIKSVWPTTKIYAPVVAQDGMIYAHDYSGAVAGEFLDYYLAQMVAASKTAGAPLLDVLDVHYYNSNGDAAQCLQNPRMFWDPNYTQLSASATDDVDFGWSGINNYFDTNWYPRQVAPRLLAKIAAAYPSGPAPGLSFSEYNSGCEMQIEGGVAEADNLGIFGREGVYSATAWPLQCPSGGGACAGNYLVAAYDLYRNYDGKGSVVGDTAVSATTTDVTDSSVYAFANGAAEVDVVALNKTSSVLSVTIQIANSPALTTAALYDLVGASPAVVAASGTAPTISCSGGSCSLSTTLPATSATTIVLK